MALLPHYVRSVYISGTSDFLSVVESVTEHHYKALDMTWKWRRLSHPFFGFHRSTSSIRLPPQLLETDKPATRIQNSLYRSPFTWNIWAHVEKYNSLFVQNLEKRKFYANEDIKIGILAWKEVRQIVLSFGVNSAKEIIVLFHRNCYCRNPFLRI